MKKILAMSIFLLLALTTFCQQYSKNYYLAKSQRERTTGRILLIGGGALVVGTFIANKALNNPGYGLILVPVVGVGLAIASVPFLNAAYNNKQKAKNLSASFQLDNVQVLFKQNGKNSICYTAVALRFHLP